MQCPHCRVSLTTYDEAHPGKYDCPRCQGMWLSAETVLSLVTRRGEPGETALELSRLATGNKGRIPDLRCPQCDEETLDRHVYGIVEAEFCTGCEGLFLDDGELTAMKNERRRARGQRWRMILADLLEGRDSSRGADPQSQSELVRGLSAFYDGMERL